MKIKFRVHSVTTVPVERNVEVQKSTVRATIQGLRVELVGEEDGVGSLTLTFVDPKAIEEAHDLYQTDETVVFST